MGLKVVGAGLPRTGTASQKMALEKLLGGTCCHMSVLSGHPFDLGEDWDGAILGRQTNWDALMAPFTASLDFPASLCWRELSEANPDALVLLSVRDSAEVWWESMDMTVLRVARRALGPGWQGGTSLFSMMERFTGTRDWDHPEILMESYDRHNDEVRKSIPHGRLLEFNVKQGWKPLCQALEVPVPQEPFPWTNKRGDWS